MAEDFPEDSIFRKSNVALLDADFGGISRNEKRTAPVGNGNQCGLAFHTSDPHSRYAKTDTHHQNKELSSVLKFTTAKDLLLSRKGEKDPISASTSISLNNNVHVSCAKPIDSENLNIDLQTDVKSEDTDAKKPRCKTESKVSKNIQKNENVGKDKSKCGYRPLNITKNVSSSSKQTESLSHDVLYSSDTKDVAESSHSVGDSKRFEEENSTIATQEKLKLESWGLPLDILHQYAKKGVTSMFKWQVECLCCPRVLNGGNLVYSAPTSAGKTLVSEIICIKTVIERRKKVLFILPFISVVREKMYYFQELMRGSGIRVDGFMGGHSPPGGFRAVDFAVCTIEKANSLVNRLMEEGSLSDLGAVIVDELHLIGDSHRGYLLELLLTKLKFMSSKESDICIQLVGMSATLPNLSLLSTWLDADLYKTTFRPVPLEEFIKVGNIIYNQHMQVVRTVIPEIKIKTDSEDIVYLCLETIADGHSVLIFCPTKSWCESLAQTIAVEFKTIGSDRDVSAPQSLAYKLREQLSANAIAQVLEQLQRCPAGLDSVLRKVISFGVAYHHAGLTMDERDIVEGSFRNGALRVIVATSTLSSGVNLPARRVIIRTPMFQSRPIDILSYKQMAGRAGRMGVDSAGESFLICQKSEQRVAEKLLKSELSPIKSCLGSGSLSAGLKRAILEVIAGKVACTPQDVELYTNCTLLAASFKETARTSDAFSQSFGSSGDSNPITICVEFLEKNEFIRLQAGENGTRYVPTLLGEACLAASLPPDEGLLLFKELERARQCLVLENELHMLYQVTPFYVAEQWSNVDWLQVLAMWEQLSADMKRVGELVGVEDRFIVRALRGTINAKLEKQRLRLMIHRRFYSALALHDLVNEVSLNTVAMKFSCPRGLLQSLQQSAATYAGMVTAFCRRLGWSNLELLMEQFQDRLHFGSHRDLLDLLRLPSLNSPRARALHNAGITTRMELTTADVLVVENALHGAVPFLSDKERDGETAFDAEHRRKLKSIWITGRQGLTERDAAQLIIHEARTTIQMELGLKDMFWDETKAVRDSSCNDRSEGVLNISVKCIVDNKQERDPRSQPASNTIVGESDEFQLYPESNRAVCMDMSKKLSSKVNRILKTLEGQNFFKNKEEENVDTAIKCVEGSTGQLNESHNLDNMSVHVDVIETETICDEDEKEIENADSEEATQSFVSNNALDSNILPSSSSNGTLCPSPSPQSTSQQEDGSRKAMGKVSRRNSLDMFSENSISNTDLARLDYDFHEKCADADLNNGHLEFNSSCEEKSGDLSDFRPNQTQCSSEHDVEVPEFEIKGEQVVDCCTSLPGSAKRRLSEDMFTQSPESCFTVKAASLCRRETTPVERMWRRNGSGSGKTARGKNPSRSPSAAGSPCVGMDNRSPSLFGDSFEMDTHILEAVDGVLTDDKFEICYESQNSESCRNQSPLEEHGMKKVSDLSKHYLEGSASRFSDGNSPAIVQNVTSRCKSKAFSSINNSLETAETMARRESIDCEKQSSKHVNDRHSQKGSCIFPGLRRKPKWQSTEEKCEMQMCTDSITDSFLGAAFQSAFEYSETINLKRSLKYSPEKENVCARRSEGGGNFVETASTITDEGLSERPNKRMKLELPLEKNTEKEEDLTPSSEIGMNEDIVLSSQETVCAFEKTLRISRRACSNLNRNSGQETVKARATRTSQRLLQRSGTSAIGPPPHRQETLQSTLPKPTDLEEINNYLSRSCETEEGSDQCNPFRASVDWSSINIIDVCGNANLFSSFIQALSTVKAMSISLACEKFEQQDQPETKIGGKIQKASKSSPRGTRILQKKIQHLANKNHCLVGVSFCFGGTDVFFINLKNESEETSVSQADRMSLIRGTLGCVKDKTMRIMSCFDLKEQYKMLYRCAGIEMCCITSCDPKVADWLLEPEGKEKNLQALVVKYLEEAVRVVDHAGNVRGGVGSPALDVAQSIPARRRSAAEAVLSWNLMRVQFDALGRVGILDSFTRVEMPVLLCVARMELSGIGFSSETVQSLRDELISELDVLQEQAYKLAGHPFSLTSPADTAQVLYRELKLRPSDLKKGGTKSTSKEALSKLTLLHPLPGLILLWRKMNSILTKSVSPLLFGTDRRVFGEYITHTATGRLLMHEPNLQNIPRDFDISHDRPQNFSMRAAFVPSEGHLLVAADYSQLELRLLAHLSGDEVLKGILNSGQDVFCSIAASWHNVPEAQVTDKLRQQAKQICYGILYGMGVSALAEQLEVKESEARILIDKFRVTYPGVRQYVDSTIEFCRKHGYVETLFGRRRQLSAITSSNAHARAHAERQAVNTTVQGSAADVAKSAMVALEEALHGHEGRSSIRLVLHLHDELVYEVPGECLHDFGTLLRDKMENAVSISVHLPVKVKKGKSWGTLENF